MFKNVLMSCGVGQTFDNCKLTGEIETYIFFCFNFFSQKNINFFYSPTLLDKRLFELDRNCIYYSQ